MAASSTTPSTLARAPGAGKSDALRRIAYSLFLLAVLCAAAADAQPVNGRSRELGIAFETIGGEQWCSPAVAVQLTAQNAAAYNLDHAPFALMLGRIRAILVDQCRATELITFDGAAAGRRVFLAEASKLTQWRRFIGLDPTTQQPMCQGASRNSAECDKRAAAYITAKQLMRGSLFDDADLATFLDTGSEEHLAWRTQAVAGRLQLTNPEELGGQYENIAALADAIIGQSADACAGAGGQSGQIATGDYVGDIAYRSLACQPSGQAIYQVSTVIVSRGGWYYVFSLSGEGVNIAAVDDMAGHLIRSIGAQ